MIHKAATVLVFGVATAAQADFFFIGTEGTFDVTDRNADVIDANIATTVDTQFGGFDFQDVSGVFNAELVDGGEISGQLELNGPGGGDALTIQFLGSVDAEDGFFSYAGSWDVTDGTGIYDGLVGDGTLSGSHFFQQADSGFASLDVQGDLVPAPATIALFLGAGLGLTRRRR